MIGKLGMMTSVIVLLIGLAGCDTAMIDMSGASENLAAVSNELAESIMDLKATVLALGD
jgi:hypothetical protein